MNTIKKHFSSIALITIVFLLVGYSKTGYAMKDGDKFQPPSTSMKSCAASAGMDRRDGSDWLTVFSGASYASLVALFSNIITRAAASPRRSKLNGFQLAAIRAVIIAGADKYVSKAVPFMIGGLIKSGYPLNTATNAIGSKVS